MLLDFLFVSLIKNFPFLMYNYRAYGLIIYSEIYFPELYEIDIFTTADVEIKYGSVPSKINIDSGLISDKLSISPQVYLLKIEGIATYLVEDGKTILIELAQEEQLDEMRLFCLSNAFAALLHQRGQIPLHAAAFMYDNQLILIMGESGAGKSTTLAAMVNKGYAPFSDDVCVPYYDSQNRSWYAYSSYPMMKYWADTFAKVKINNADEGRKLRSAFDKYGFFFHEKFKPESRKIRLIILLEKDSTQDEVHYKQLSGIEAFEKIHAQAYRKEYLEYESLLKDHFVQSTEMAKSVKSILVSRPENSDSISTIVDYVESLIFTETLTATEENVK